jgi:hypothetical protein
LPLGGRGIALPSRVPSPWAAKLPPVQTAEELRINCWHNLRFTFGFGGVVGQVAVIKTRCRVVVGLRDQNRPPTGGIPIGWDLLDGTADWRGAGAPADVWGVAVSRACGILHGTIDPEV